MSRKPFALLILLSVAALAACSDVTGPDTDGFCSINGGPGTCVTAEK